MWLPVDYRSTVSAVWNGPSHMSASPSPCSPSISRVAIGLARGQVVTLGLIESGPILG